MLFSSQITCNCLLTCCCHVLTGPYWLKAHKGDLHRQDQANDVEGAVGWRDKSTSSGQSNWKQTTLTHQINIQVLGNANKTNKNCFILQMRAVRTVDKSTTPTNSLYQNKCSKTW